MTDSTLVYTTTTPPAPSRVPTKQALVESTTLTEATRGQKPTGRRMSIRLIDSGWGSSGYYSEAVLKEAAATRVFKAGTQMYLDHPSQTEQYDRPERSVKDLAAALATDAVYRDGALYAEAEVFTPYRQVLAEQADHIGVSIRAIGTAEPGEADGRSGTIITSLDEARSVDFVTQAGRGGQIVALLESARRELAEARNIGQWLEARLHSSFTELTDGMYGDGYLTREERIGLSSAIGDGLAAFTARVEADHPQLYQRDLWADPGPQDMAMAERSTSTTTTGRAGMSGTDNTGTPAPDGGGAQTGELSEAQKRAAELEAQLTEARAQVEQLSDNAVRADRAERGLQEARTEAARLRAADVARQQVAALLNEAGLPEGLAPIALPRVTAIVVGHEGRAVPLTEAHALDTERLKQSITAAIDSEKAYIGAILEAAGMGRIRGLGGNGDEPTLTDADFEAKLSGLFTEAGMDKTTAQLAAKGR